MQRDTFLHNLDVLRVTYGFTHTVYTYATWKYGAYILAYVPRIFIGTQANHMHLWTSALQ